MSTNYYRSRQPAETTEYGVEEEPNPGEQATTALGVGFRASALATLPTVIRSAVEGGPIDVGAQVGVLRNLEFSAGGRSHRISTGPYAKA